MGEEKIVNVMALHLTPLLGMYELLVLVDAGLLS
jgi:hypothetical protein